jgi:truncated hemoglobin YjbI
MDAPSASAPELIRPDEGKDHSAGRLPAYLAGRDWSEYMHRFVFAMQGDAPLTREELERVLQEWRRALDGLGPFMLGSEFEA